MKHDGGSILDGHGFHWTNTKCVIRSDSYGCHLFASEPAPAEQNGAAVISDGDMHSQQGGYVREKDGTWFSSAVLQFLAVWNEAELCTAEKSGGVWNTLRVTHIQERL